MAGKKWSKKECSYLVNHYTDDTKENLLYNLKGRSWDAVKIKAEKLKITRSKSFRRSSDCSPLLEETVESYYWLGFIMADGHISNGKRLRVSISIKDDAHLKKLSKLIECKTTYHSRDDGDQIYLSVQDDEKIPILVRKFDIQSNKTENPCKIDAINDDALFLSWLVGFIDGDGYVGNQWGRKDYQIRIKCHKSWLKNFLYIQKRLSAIFGVKMSKAKLNNFGYANVSICNNRVIIGLKKFVLDNSLPALERKWDIIK